LCDPHRRKGRVRKKGKAIKKPNRKRGKAIKKLEHTKGES
jgi:hypothetical protein